MQVIYSSQQSTNPIHKKLYNFDYCDKAAAQFCNAVHFWGHCHVKTYDIKRHLDFRLEFPYPKDAPFKDKSAVVKDTNSPEFNHSVKVPLNLKDKSCARLFKPPGRQTAKVEVWSKVGFLRSDVCVGSVQVKLTPLESKCELHDTFPLMEGRVLQICQSFSIELIFYFAKFFWQFLKTFTTMGMPF